MTQLKGHWKKYMLKFTHKYFHHKRIRGEYICQWKIRTNTVVYWLHTISCVVPPFSPHQNIHSMQFTKEQFTTLNRYFTINFDQIYFCVKAMLITYPSRPWQHMTVKSAILYSVPLEIHRSSITDPKERNSERRDEMRDAATRTSHSITVRWVCIVHRSTVTDTFRSTVGVFL